MILKPPLSTMEMMDPALIPDSSPLYLLDQQVVVRPPGRSTHCRNQFCSCQISTHLSNSKVLYTSPCSLMTCPSPIFQERYRSIWSTENNQEQFELCTEQLTCPKEWLSALQRTGSPSQSIQLLKEE